MKETELNRARFNYVCWVYFEILSPTPSLTQALVLGFSTLKWSGHTGVGPARASDWCGAGPEGGSERRARDAAAAVGPWKRRRVSLSPLLQPPPIKQRS